MVGLHTFNYQHFTTIFLVFQHVYMNISSSIANLIKEYSQTQFRKTDSINENVTIQNTSSKALSRSSANAAQNRNPKINISIILNDK